MTTTRRLTAALLASSALVLAAPTAAQARPVPEEEMDRSYTGPTGTREVQPLRCAPRSFIGLNCVVPRVYTAILRFL